MSEFPLLAILLELPTFAVLAWLFARGRARRYWLPVVAGAFALAIAATWWSFAAADPRYGALWPQVLAALNGYAVYLAALAIAWLLPRLAERNAPSSGR